MKPHFPDSRAQSRRTFLSKAGMGIGSLALLDLLSREAQALCFFAGANSIFYGDKLLTAPNPEKNEDVQLLRTLGLTPQEPNRDLMAPATEAGKPRGPLAACAVPEA